MNIVSIMFHRPFFLLVAFFLALTLAQQQRNLRDVGGHHHHHEDHEAIESQVTEQKVLPPPVSGYSRDTPKEPLPVRLAEKSNGKGYPRENPANPLKLDGESANTVEVRVDPTTTMSPLMMLMKSVPGTPGEDYPIFDTIPETKFDCKDQATGGYYADVDEGRCQVFHVCHDNRKFSFLCPNGTIFDQQVFVCNWWFNVDCSASAQFYGLNAQIGVVPEKPANGASSTNGVRGSNGKARPEPSAEASVARPINLEYIPPPKEESGDDDIKRTTTTPSSQYIPPSSIPPNAAEAITNGIISSTPPSLAYLPPVNTNNKLIPN